MAGRGTQQRRAAPISRHTAGTIERAIDILREASTARELAQTKGVALALWVLRGYCGDDWLKLFWEAAGSEQELGRSQSLHATFNGIVRQVRERTGRP